jgi:hypothetical protein
VVNAVSAGGLEKRSWQSLQESGGLSTSEENRAFHLRRIGTLIQQDQQNGNAAVHPDINHRIIVVLGSGGSRIWAHSGNHRIAAAYLQGRGFIDLDLVTPEPSLIAQLLPGAERINELPEDGK